MAPSFPYTEDDIINQLDGTPLKKEYTNDSEEAKTRGAIKYDAGKSPVYRGGLGYFGRAMESVAAVSAFGASKYAWEGWRSVDNGFERYADAMVRHLIAHSKGEVLDPDSGLPHLAHCCWNANAVLELWLTDNG